MKRFLFAGLVALALFLLTAPTYALVMAPASVLQRLAQSDAVVVGQVTDVEATPIKAKAPYPGAKNDVEYLIATVKVSEGILGTKAGTTIKVAFQPPRETPAPQTGGNPAILPIRRYPQFTLAKGDEGLLFLTKHPEKDFLVGVNYFDVTFKNNEKYAKEVETAKKAGALLADPKKGLQSKDAEERLDTAALLVLRYRKGAGPNPKTEAIDAAESKLILNVLAQADWSPSKDPEKRQLGAQMVFSRLNLTAKDGWTPPKNFKEFEAEAKKWLKANAETYRIQRFVEADTKK